MSTNHATWKLSVDKSFNVVNEDGDVLIPWPYTDFTVEDMQRVVACWNACEGLTKDHFDGDWTAKGLSKYARSLEDNLAAERKELAAARALLTEVVEDEAVEAHPGAREIFARINAFLKGGAA